MGERQTVTGSDLFVDIDRRHVRASFEAALRAAVQSGRLCPALKLPSSRSLAADIKVSRNTVAEAYGLLVAEGWLTTRVGSGTFVADRVPVSPVEMPQLMELYRPASTHDLRPGWPDPTSFPQSAWLAAARRALAAAPMDAFGYQEPRGRPELRRALAQYLARARGVRVDAEQIVICLGISHGLRVLGTALRARGASSWAFDSHGLWVHRQDAAALGYTLRLLPVDAHGTDISALDADVALLAPNHQFPFGVALSPLRRQQVARWATTSGYLIEDDYDGEFRYDRTPLGALQGLAPERIIYAGTTSKSLGPALRLGWLVVPPDLLNEVMEAKTLSSGQNSVLDQLTLAELIRSGDYDRHIRRARITYRRRRDLLLAALRPFRQIRTSGIAAGLHLLVQLPSQVEEAEVVAVAARRGLLLEGLRTYAADPSSPTVATLVIGYGSAPESTYLDCLERLTDTLRDSGAR